MAVTQFLLRIHVETALAARLNQEVVERIISFDLRPGEGAENFDWSPMILVRALEAAGRRELVKTITQAFEGEELLNDSSPFGTSRWCVYSEIRINKAAKVAQLAGELDRLPIEDMSKMEMAVRAMSPNRELPEKFSEYVVKYATALKSFYAVAAQRNQEVVTWWD